MYAELCQCRNLTTRLRKLRERLARHVRPGEKALRYDRIGWKSRTPRGLDDYMIEREELQEECAALDQERRRLIAALRPRVLSLSGDGFALFVSLYYLNAYTREECAEMVNRHKATIERYIQKSKSL